MDTKKTLKLTSLWRFFAGGMVFLIAFFSPFLVSGEADDSGAISGTVKVFRARHSGDVVIYLESESLQKEFSPPEEHAILDQKNLLFVPHVLPVLKGTTVDFHNSDDVQHNIFSPGKTEKFNLGTWGLDGVRSYTFNEPGEAVILCNVHSEMAAYIIVLENPYFARSDEKGNFKIENVPSGTYLLKTWHEKMKSASQEVTIAKGEIKEIHLDLNKKK